MLISHTTTLYHRQVPIQVGSQIMDQVTNCITEEELQSLSQSWKLAYASIIIVIGWLSYEKFCMAPQIKVT